MKVEVDQFKCRTAGMCVKKCPEIFRFQEGSKKAAAVQRVVPASLKDKCLEAAKSCPNDAVIIIYDT